MCEVDEAFRFVDLNRTFYELPKNVKDQDAFDLRRNHGGKRLTWVDLAQSFRVVILSESGSGKTREIHRLAETMRSCGKEAFFLRLEHISSDFEDSFEVGSFEEFDQWLSSSSEGWLLLDSIDEARLRDQLDFETAIRKLGRRIATAHQRAHIIITGRPEAWRPKSDLDLCIKYLPHRPSYRANQPKIDLLSQGVPESDLRREDASEQAEHSEFRVVALNDLNSDQVKTFAAAREIKHIDKFLEAVDRSDAWAFTARPQDLEELLGFWSERGAIGTRRDIIECSIHRRLTERDQGRADARPLSPVRAREGARLVAAAATLSRNSTIRVPDGAANSKGIPITEILPDWDDRDRATLLTRPIFDEAIYGTVRFHHRTVREFLTAEWLSELLNRQTSRRKIEALLFRKQYGIEVVVPTIRPVLPWLAIRDCKTLERLCKIAPEVLLEGGDPSKLPQEIRKRILLQVCEQISNGARDSVDNAAVQRFANEDLAAEIKELISVYAANNDIIFFLLRMVWIGEIRQALPEAKAFSKSKTLPRYHRIAAFRAVRAVGFPQDLDDVRAHLLVEDTKLEREWLTELLEDLEPTAGNVRWCLDSIAKSKSKEPYRSDELADAVAKFIEKIDIVLLPTMVAGLNQFLCSPPVYERGYCEISQEYGWLIAAAARAVERLVKARDPASLGDDALSILRKIPVSQQFDRDIDEGVTFQLPTLVPEWPLLNRTLFWYEAERVRDEGSGRNEGRITEWWQVSTSTSLCSFDSADFKYAVGQIAVRESLDDKLLALSLAFRLYLLGGRNRKQREWLKKAVFGNSELAEKLTKYLSPPPLEGPSLKQMEATRRRRIELQNRETAKIRAEWQSFLQTNLESLRNSGLEPGKVSNSQFYVYERTKSSRQRFERSSVDLKTVADEFGDDVALAYRDGALRFWRGYRPQFRSEGAPTNSTPFGVIFGLACLGIEANESKDWAKRLLPAETELACRYASHEFGGFPDWFPSLFVANPSIVRKFLIDELRYELSIDGIKNQSTYVLYGIGWSGEWVWNDLAPDVLSILTDKEPRNIHNLGDLLNILQGSSISDVDIARLASRKCKRLQRLDRVARWLAVWVGVDPAAAIPALANQLENISEDEKRTKFACDFVTKLLGGCRGEVSRVRSGFHTPLYLKQLYLLMHEYIRTKDDTNRVGTGGYSPGLRDYAQDARQSLAELIRRTPGKDAFIALLEIADIHPDDRYKPWFQQYAKAKAEIDADVNPWLAEDVRNFHVSLERTPANHRELADLIHLRFLDLKDDLENGDSSIATILQRVTRETEMRTFIERELREKAFGRYCVPQEEELADAKRPDLRIHGNSFDGPVPCELKLAQKWSGAECFERLANQLCGDYLRDNRSSRGLFVLVLQGTKKSWTIPNSGKRVDFEGLIVALQRHWEAIAIKFPKIDDIQVIGIDLTRRSR